MPQTCIYIYIFVWGIAIYINIIRVIIVINSISSILHLILYHLTVVLKCFVGLKKGAYPENLSVLVCHRK